MAIHILRNMIVKHYVEMDSEKLLMILRMYILTLDGQGKDKGEAYLRSIGREKKSDITQVMNHAETREYLLVLDSLEEHFHFHDIFSTWWIHKHLHLIGGGVSHIYVSQNIHSNHGVRL